MQDRRLLSLQGKRSGRCSLKLALFLFSVPLLSLLIVGFLISGEVSPSSNHQVDELANEKSSPIMNSSVASNEEVYDLKGFQCDYSKFRMVSYY